MDAFSLIKYRTSKRLEPPIEKGKGTMLLDVKGAADDGGTSSHKDRAHGQSKNGC